MPLTTLVSLNDPYNTQQRVISWISNVQLDLEEVACGASPPNSRKRKRDVLGSTQGNIMAPTPRRSPRKSTKAFDHQVAADSQAGPGPSTPPRPSRHDQPSGTGPEAEDQTPKPPNRRAPQLSPAKFLPPPTFNAPTLRPGSAHNSEGTDDLPHSSAHASSFGRSTNPSGSTSSGGPKSSRSKSPVKSFADLRDATIPTKYKKLKGAVVEKVGGVLDRYDALRAASKGIAVIPYSLKGLVEANLHEKDRPIDSAYMSPSQSSPDLAAYHQHLGQQALQICAKAEDCHTQRETESEWNSLVHRPLLDLVASHPRYASALKAVNLTAARIQPSSLSMVQVGGGSMQGKMVDYGVVLLPSEAGMKGRIRSALNEEGIIPTSINQTHHQSIREQPIAISMETKRLFDGGETADVQLAVWLGAGFQRLKQLQASAARSSDDIPAMPALFMHGHELYLSVLKRKPHKTKMYGYMRLGSSVDLWEFFQLVACLEILYEWAHTDFRAWYLENILS